MARPPPPQRIKAAPPSLVEQAVAGWLVLMLPSNRLLLLVVIATMLSMAASDTTLSSCTSNSQCDDGQCCAMKLIYSTGFCLRRKGLGEVCNPAIEIGKEFTCGCEMGLTCAIVEEDKQKVPKYRCVRVPTESPELRESAADTVGITADAKQLSRIGRTMMSALNDLLLKVKSTKRKQTRRTRSKKPT